MNGAFRRWLKGLTDEQLDALTADSEFDLSTVSDADLERLEAGEAAEVVLGSDWVTRYRKRGTSTSEQNTSGVKGRRSVGSCR